MKQEIVLNNIKIKTENTDWVKILLEMTKESLKRKQDERNSYR